MDMGYREYVKSQVTSADWAIIERMSLTLDSAVIAAMWPDYVDVDARIKTETPFIVKQMGDGYRSFRVLDAAAGIGVTSIGLLLAGVENIVTNEFDEYFRPLAVQTAAKYGIELELTGYDWRELPKEWEDSFDAVLCLGNSLTYLFKQEDRLKAVGEFNRVLKPGNGKLIIDERNYEKVLRTGEWPGGANYDTSKVTAVPIYLSQTMIIVEFQHQELELKAHLVFNPGFVEQHGAEDSFVWRPGDPTKGGPGLYLPIDAV